MPNNHGGKRKGAGRKASPYPLQIIKIACTDEEAEQIRQSIPNTRQRAEILLKQQEQPDNGQ